LKIKINSNRNWDRFVKAGLDKIIYANRNKNDDSIMYVFNYEGDSVDFILANVVGLILQQKKTITIDKDQYYDGDADDETILEDCIKRLSS